MKKGKACAHRTGNRKGDLYYTPKSLVWTADHIIKREFTGDILEPCAGIDHFPICEVLNLDIGIRTFGNDLFDRHTGKNYLEENKRFNAFDEVITNPPFSLWDDFILKAKTHCKKFMFIGRLNYYGTQSRVKKGIWNNLKGFYPFSRYVDYQGPYREDGLFHVGYLATAWFLWDMEYTGGLDFEILDVSKWAKLGPFIEESED